MNKTIRRANLQPLDEIDMSVYFRSALNGKSFVINDSAIGENRILVFATKVNISIFTKGAIMAYG